MGATVNAARKKSIGVPLKASVVRAPAPPVCVPTLNVVGASHGLAKEI